MHSQQFRTIKIITSAICSNKLFFLQVGSALMNDKPNAADPGHWIFFKATNPTHFSLTLIFLHQRCSFSWERIINFWAVVVAQLLERLLPISRGLQLESSHWQKQYWTFTVNCFEKTKIKKKKPGMALFKKRIRNLTMTYLSCNSGKFTLNLSDICCFIKWVFLAHLMVYTSFQWLDLNCRPFGAGSCSPADFYCIEAVVIDNKTVFLKKRHS